MREPEGIETPLPGKSSERSWSKHREPDIRNVEAEGSSPFTSTKGSGHRAKVGSPRRSDSATCLYVSLSVARRANRGRLNWTHFHGCAVVSRRPKPRIRLGLEGRRRWRGAVDAVDWVAPKPSIVVDDKEDQVAVLGLAQ